MNLETIISTAVGVFAGGLITIAVSYLFYVRAGRELQEEAEKIREESKKLRELMVQVTYVLTHPGVKVEFQIDEQDSKMFVSGTGVSAGGNVSLGVGSTAP
jgi:hypothetical protein